MKSVNEKRKKYMHNRNAKLKREKVLEYLNKSSKIQQKYTDFMEYLKTVLIKFNLTFHNTFHSEFLSA